MPPQIENNLPPVVEQTAPRRTRLIVLVGIFILVGILATAYFIWQAKFYKGCDQCSIPVTMMYPGAKISTSTTKYINMETSDGRLKVQNYYESELSILGWNKISNLGPEDATKCGGDWGGTYKKDKLKFKLHVCGFPNPGPLTNISFDYLGNSELANILFQNSTSTTDEFASWQTYRNEEYGFELKYPKDEIKISENKNFSPLGPSIYFPTNAFQVVIDTSYKGNFSEYLYLGQTAEENTADYKFYTMQNSSVPFVAFAKNKNGKIYIIEFQGNTTLEPIESKIFATFKFITTSTSVSN